MRRFYPALALVFIALFSMACNFSPRLDDQQAATIEPLPTAVAGVDVVDAPPRPQTAFIDGRDQPEGTVNQGEVVSVQPNTSNAQSQLVAQSGDGGGSGGAGAYASGGYSGGTGSYDQPGSYAAQGGYGNCCHQPPQCTPNYSWQFTYVIQRGDTLSRIARAAGISTQQLAAANCISNPNLIYPGQVIKVPCYIPPPPPPPCCHQPPPHYPPPHHPTYPPPVYPTPVPPTVISPPVIVGGSGLTFAPVDSINNNTVILPPDVLVTISWPATFPSATERVVFELIPPGMGSGSPIGIDTNLGDGANIVWNSVNGTQGTVRAVAYFTGGYAPQISDFYYIIAGFPIT